MHQIQKDLLELQENWGSILRKLELRQEKNASLPAYGVRVSSSNGSPQYHLTQPGDSLGKYANRSQRKLVTDLVQKDYEEKLIKEISKQMLLLGRFQKEFDPDCLATIYRKFPAGKRKLIQPVVESDEKYLQHWISEHPGSQLHNYEEGNFVTNRGERVRSKSEKIIADLLDYYEAPYAYESSLRLRSGYIVYPDFVILNQRLRKTIYWEHFGLLDDVEYTYKNMRKINDYEHAGFLLGDELITSMESKRDVLDTRMVKEKIEKYCL